MMKVTYIGHSGFLAETEEGYLLFDYYKGSLPQTDPEKELFVFVSHAHYDHYNREIFRLRGTGRRVRFILSSDVPVREEDRADDLVTAGPGEELEIDGSCTVRTLRSNDEGVAFLVHFGERTFYHAGDLNWWHWEGEPEEYNRGMRRSYQSEINKLQGEKIDAAFVPVDPRLGEQYAWGIDCFMKRTDTRYVFPMHFWGNFGVYDRLMLEKCTEDYRERIVKISREGETVCL